MSAAPPPARRRPLQWFGPALIVACVVLGPGSIMASSRVGAEHGYRLVWVLALSAGLMMAMVALGARLGVGLRGTPCTELAQRLGRPVAVGVGLIVFLIIVCFQVGNNTAVLAALPAVDPTFPAGPSAERWPVLALFGLNGLALAGLYGSRRLYRVVERLMIGLVFLMIVGFVGNLFFVRPDLLAAVRGLVPQLPADFGKNLLPTRSGDTVIDPLGSIPALVATTMSIAGAFYQAYLVREKGWTLKHVRHGTIDTLLGIAVLSGITLAILLTSAAIFHTGAASGELSNTADMARQLEPLLGPWAKGLFNAGIFAAAFSSFLVNALIGGAILADGCGLDSSMDGRGAKACTALALAGGMTIALWLHTTGTSPVGIILLAQALTVLGLPALALAMLYLGTRDGMIQSGLVPRTLWIGVGLGFLVSLLLAIRKAWELWLRWT